MDSFTDFAHHFLIGAIAAYVVWSVALSLLHGV
jgi:hypothetical protein